MLIYSHKIITQTDWSSECAEIYMTIRYNFESVSGAYTDECYLANEQKLSFWLCHFVDSIKFDAEIHFIGLTINIVIKFSIIQFWNCEAGTLRKNGCGHFSFHLNWENSNYNRSNEAVY